MTRSVADRRRAVQEQGVLKGSCLQYLIENDSLSAEGELPQFTSWRKTDKQDANRYQQRNSLPAQGTGTRNLEGLPELCAGGGKRR
jgi:hypothetical protein